MYKRHTASDSIKFCHALWQVPFYQKTNCCSSSSNPVNDVDLLEVKRRRTPFSIRSNVLRKYFLRCTALVVRIDRQGRVWVVVVAQPPISCCEWWRKNPENLYLLVGSILALWGRWRRRRRSYVCLHFSHPISTSSYGNVHTAHTYFDWFRRTLKQSVSNGRSGAFRGVVKCMRRRHYRGLACALICLSGMAQLDSNERPSTGDVKAWSQMPLDRCVCVCWDCREYFRVSSPLADKLHFICTEIGSTDLADKWFCIVYQSYAILYVWHVACAQMFIRTEPRSGMRRALTSKQWLPLPRCGARWENW